MTWLVPGFFFAMLALGIPIFAVLGITTAIGFVLSNQPLTALAQKVIDELNRRSSSPCRSS